MTMTGATDPPDDSGPNAGAMGRLPNMLGLLLAKNRPIIMGVLNVTPDSFSDGGQFVDPSVAIQHAFPCKARDQQPSLSKSAIHRLTWALAILFLPSIHSLEKLLAC